MNIVLPKLKILHLGYYGVHRWFFELLHLDSSKYLHATVHRIIIELSAITIANQLKTEFIQQHTFLIQQTTLNDDF